MDNDQLPANLKWVDMTDEQKATRFDEDLSDHNNYDARTDPDHKYYNCYF